MAGAGTFRKGVMWVGVILLLVGGFGSLLGGTVSATNIMAISLASAMMLLDLTGKPAPRSPKSVIGFTLLAIAVGAALVMFYEMLSR